MIRGPAGRGKVAWVARHDIARLAVETLLGAQEWEIAGWTGSYKGIATGEISVTSHTIEHVTGRRPRTLEELLRSEPATWQHLVA